MQEWIDKTALFVRESLQDAETGHNWWHVARVWKLSLRIAQVEPVDKLVVQLGALLHDLADYKFYNGDEHVGSKRAALFLKNMEVPEDIVKHVENIVINVSFKGGNWKQGFFSKELDVVQDADRLDALGAIGIARAFNYGGFKNREMYDPSIKPVLGMTPQQYKTNTGPTINHFYEKLLLLKDKMNTATGRKIARERHAYMEHFLNRFLREWDADDEKNN